MQGPAPGTLNVHHSSATNPVWPGGTPLVYLMGRDVAQHGTGHRHVSCSLWLWYVLHQHPGKEHEQRSGPIPWSRAPSRRWVAPSPAGTVARTSFPKTPPQPIDLQKK